VEKKTQKLKGKARKEAKAASATTGSNNQAPKTKYTLAVKDFVPLASHIAGLEDKAIEVPDYFNAALDRVIQVRSLFSQKLEAAGKAIDVASDSRHAFFVSVLEQVRESIKPLLSADAFDFASVHKAVPKPDANDTRNSPLRNLFEVLDVYEPSAEFLAAPNVAPPPQPSELEATVEVPDDDIFEAYFATTSLMGDLSRLRAEVKELWRRQHTGEIDLETVSVAKNSAINLAHDLEAEIQPVLKHLTETQPWHELYFGATGAACGIDVRSQSILTQADYNFQAYDIADVLPRFWSLSCCTIYHSFIYPLISTAVLRSTTHRSASRTLHILFIVLHNRTSVQSFNSSYICAVSTPQHALFINARNAIVVFLDNDFPGEITNYNGKWGRFDENAHSPFV
jgi:hypothetical protein